MSIDRFIKFIHSEESDYLLENYPNAFLLLSLIAGRARRVSGKPDGLEIGECYIGDYEKAGIQSRQSYRTALSILETRLHIKKVESCRTRKKSTTGSTTGSTTVGTKVKLLRSDVWDINPEINNHLNPHHTNHRPTTDQPPTNHEQEAKEAKENASFAFIKETYKEKASPVFCSPLSLDERKETVDVIVGYAAHLEYVLDEKSVIKWLKYYPKDIIIKTLLRMTKSNSKIKKPDAWMQNALTQRFVEKDDFIEINHELATKIKFENKLWYLTITKQYCRDEQTGNDYQFNLDPKQFEDVFTRKYHNKEKQ